MAAQQPLTEPPSPRTLSQLRLTRERSRAPVNAFLESHHPLGAEPGWKACFGARYADQLVAVVVLGRPKARLTDDGSVLSVTRFARRDDRPDNTGSWLLARARDWARLEGYERLIAHAGVAGNVGTVYEAAGFRLARETTADGAGWTNRDGRDEWPDYTRRTYEYRFDNPLTT
jgi:GNAT superfamily N-acetyltransferase